MDIDVFQIAAQKAEALHGLQNWGKYSTTFDCSDDPRTRCSELDEESLNHVRLEMMTVNLAKRRARQSNQEDYRTSLDEVKYEVALELAKILAKSLEPGFMATEPVVVTEEEEVCGVCQEEMEIGEEVREMIGCHHRFHCFCIVKWLDHNNTCPLCRFHMQTKNFHF